MMMTTAMTIDQGRRGSKSWEHKAAICRQTAVIFFDRKDMAAQKINFVFKLSQNGRFLATNFVLIKQKFSNRKKLRRP